MPKGIPRNPSVRRKVLHRLKIARGHLDRVIRMVEEGEYCLDVVHQSLAVQSALKKADQEILKNHLQTCVIEEIKGGREEKVIEEIVKVLAKS